MTGTMSHPNSPGADPSPGSASVVVADQFVDISPMDTSPPSVSDVAAPTADSLNAPSVSSGAALQTQLPSRSSDRASASIATTTTTTPNATPNDQSAWSTVSRRRKRDNRRFRQILTLEETFHTHLPYFLKYFLLRFPSLNISQDLNVLAIDKDIRQQIGDPEKISRWGRDALLLVACSEVQSTKIRAISKVAGREVSVTPQRSFNSLRGVVRSKAFSCCSVDELQDHLASQGVTHVRRVTIKRGSENVDTDTYILSFDRHVLPRSVTLASWHRELVSPYKERPQLCYQCLRFGHVSKYCRQSLATCSRCGAQGHSVSNCTNSLSCYHCGALHLATDKDCPRYHFEAEVLATQLQRKISRTEARDIVSERLPDSERLFSSVARMGSSHVNRTASSPPLPTLVTSTSPSSGTPSASPAATISVKSPVSVASPVSVSLPVSVASPVSVLSPSSATTSSSTSVSPAKGNISSCPPSGASVVSAPVTALVDDVGSGASAPQLVVDGVSKTVSSSAASAVSRSGARGSSKRPYTFKHVSGSSDSLSRVAEYSSEDDAPARKSSSAKSSSHKRYKTSIPPPTSSKSKPPKDVRHISVVSSNKTSWR